VLRRFFVDRFSEGRAALSGEAAHHLGTVLRAEPGQLYELSDGAEVQLARVVRVGRNVVDFATVERVVTRPSRLSITLLVAVVKFHRLEWALEKATELGVEAVVPLAAARSDRALVAAAHKRAARWRKILLESAQQARTLRPPELRNLAPAAEAFRSATGALRLLLSERPGAPGLRAVLDDAAPIHSTSTAIDPLRISMAAGPEGGWTEDELAAAVGAGFREAALGRNILRTETAVVAGLAAVQSYWDCD